MVKTPPTSSTTRAPHCHHLTNQRRHDLRGQNTFPDVFLVSKKNTVFRCKVNYRWWFRNPANQLINSLSHHLQGFIHPRWLSGISEPSSVSHPNYLCTKKGCCESKKPKNRTQEVQRPNSLITDHLKDFRHLLCTLVDWDSPGFYIVS